VVTNLDGVPLAITLLGYTAEGQPDLGGVLTRWKHERTEMLRKASANHRLLNIEVSYEISIKGPRMTEEGLRLLRVLGCLPNGVDHDHLDAVYPVCGHKAAAILRQTGLAFDDGSSLRVLAPLREYMWRKHPPQAEDLDPAFAYYIGLDASLHGGMFYRGGPILEELRRKLLALAQVSSFVNSMKAMIQRARAEGRSQLADYATMKLGRRSA
jgi:hypothetical protein